MFKTVYVMCGLLVIVLCLCGMKCYIYQCHLDATGHIGMRNVCMFLSADRIGNISPI